MAASSIPISYLESLWKSTYMTYLQPKQNSHFFFQIAHFANFELSITQ